MSTPHRPSQKLTIATAQLHTQPTLASTLALLKTTTQTAASNNAALILFPEAFLGGYPRSCTFGSAVGSRSSLGREQYLQYWSEAVDLGDTVLGAGEEWIARNLPVNAAGRRGDGTREFVEDVARQTGVFVVTGVVEKCGGSLYCAALFVDPVRGVIGKRRKVMPTASERLVWSVGQPSTLKVVQADIRGVSVVMGCAICWENYMPLLRYSLYAQGVNLWLAPTADQRPTWQSLMQTVAFEGRCWVVSGNQCVKRKDLPQWITGEGGREAEVNGVGGASAERSTSGTGRRMSMTTKTDENHEIAWRLKHGGEATAVPEEAVGDSNGTTSGEEFASRGGSLIVSPMGTTVAGPVWDKDEELIYAEIDFDDCARGKLDFDAVGHYGRTDAFHLTVDGLDLNPPP